MDVRVIKKDGFRPITLELSIEYEADLLNLLIRLNMAPSKINPFLDNVETQRENRYLDARADNSAQILWEELDTLAEEYGLTNAKIGAR